MQARRVTAAATGVTACAASFSLSRLARGPGNVCKDGGCAGARGHRFGQLVQLTASVRTLSSSGGALGVQEGVSGRPDVARPAILAI